MRIFFRHALQRSTLLRTYSEKVHQRQIKGIRGATIQEIAILDFMISPAKYFWYFYLFVLCRYQFGKVNRSMSLTMNKVQSTMTNKIGSKIEMRTQNKISLNLL